MCQRTRRSPQTTPRADPVSEHEKSGIKRYTSAMAKPPPDVLERLSSAEFVITTKPKTPYIRIGMCARCRKPFLEPVDHAGPPHQLCPPCRLDQRRAKTRERVQRLRARRKAAKE